MAMIKRVNRISYWVPNVILWHSSMNDRGKVVEKFIALADVRPSIVLTLSLSRLTSFFLSFLFCVVSLALCLWSSVTLWSLTLSLSRTDTLSTHYLQTDNGLQELRKLRNFSALMGVLGGLGMSSTARLKFTFLAVNEQKLALLKELQTLMSSSKSFGAYRAQLAACQAPLVPYLCASTPPPASRSKTFCSSCQPWPGTIRFVLPAITIF